jgi:hypothetical protein
MEIKRIDNMVQKVHKAVEGDDILEQLVGYDMPFVTSFVESRCRSPIRSLNRYNIRSGVFKALDILWEKTNHSLYSRGRNGRQYHVKMIYLVFLTNVEFCEQTEP